MKYKALGTHEMNDSYKSYDLRNTLVAIVCAMVLGSVALFGAVGPAEASSAPTPHTVHIAAQPHG
jgi:hypothetical protein